VLWARRICSASLEKQELTAVFLAQLLRPTTEDAPSQKPDLLEVLQGFMLVVDLLGAFLFQAGLEVTNAILQFLYTVPQSAVSLSLTRALHHEGRHHR
jgi:hypothetical protein